MGVSEPQGEDKAAFYFKRWHGKMSNLFSMKTTCTFDWRKVPHHTADSLHVLFAPEKN